jgi:hypothetical protein
MAQDHYKISGNRLYLSGEWSGNLENILANSNVTEIEFLEDWKDFSCFERIANAIEYIKLCGSTVNGKISTIDNITVFSNLKKTCSAIEGKKGL